MWPYIPNVGNPVRITTLQSVVGGVFYNADILKLDYAAEYDVEKAEETKEGYLLYLKVKTKTVAYDQLKIWADKKNVLPTKIECLTPSLTWMMNLDDRSYTLTPELAYTGFTC